MFRLVLTSAGTLVFAENKPQHSRAEVDASHKTLSKAADFDVLDEDFIERLDAMDSDRSDREVLNNRLADISPHSSMMEEQEEASPYGKPGDANNYSPHVHSVGPNGEVSTEYAIAAVEGRGNGPPTKRKEKSDDFDLEGHKAAAARQKSNEQAATHQAALTSAVSDDEKSASQCFAGISTVQTPDGAVKPLQHVAHGELVRSAVGFEPVIGFLHTGAQDADVFLRIEHSAGILLVSPGHRLFASNGLDVLAKDVRVGDALSAADKTIVVTDISVVSVDSIFAPLTASGTIVVDNVLASSYADVPHFIGQFALAPVRLAMSFFGAEQQRTVSVSTAPVPIFSSN